jgi:hypothetical protein
MCTYLLNPLLFTHFVGFVEVLQLWGRGDDWSSGPGVVVAVGGDVVRDGGVVLRLYSTLPQFLASHPWNPVSNVVKSVSLRKNPSFQLKLVKN